MSTEERLASVERKLDLLLDRFAVHSERVEGLQRTVYGKNGEEPGLRLDVALLKSAAERGRWTTRAAVGALIVTAVGAAWQALSRG